MKLFSLSKEKALLWAFSFLAVEICQGQQFNIRPIYGFNTLVTGVWEVLDGYMTSSLTTDTVGGFHYEMVISKFNFEGIQQFENHTGNNDDSFFPGGDANYKLSDTLFLVACERSIHDSIFCSLNWINQFGDTLQTRKFFPPWNYTTTDSPTNYIKPRYLVVDSNDNIYIANATVNYGSWNNFSIYKISPEGELLWIHNYATSADPDLCYSLIAQDDGVIVGGGYTTNGGEPPVVEHIFKLKPNGEADYLWEFFNDFEFSTGYIWEMVMDGDYIVVATDHGDDEGEDDGLVPLVYKVDTLGNVQWQIFPTANFENEQRGSNLVKSTDGGYLCVSQKKYDYGLDPPDGNYYDWYAWLIKISEDGEIEWERFYRFVESVFDTHEVYDLKATSDGGYIFCGEATEPGSQQGWVVKVDGCGCLVPGCDESCTVGIDESQVQAPRYFIVGPNPASQFLNIHLSQYPLLNSHYQFQLHDMSGNLLKEFEARTGNTTYMLDVEKFEGGSYVLSLIEDGRVVQSEQFVKQ